MSTNEFEVSKGLKNVFNFVENQHEKTIDYINKLKEDNKSLIDSTGFRWVLKHEIERKMGKFKNIKTTCKSEFNHNIDNYQAECFLKNQIVELISLLGVLYQNIDERQKNIESKMFNIFPTEHSLHPNNKKED